MADEENKFIESITFKNDFAPFKGEDTVFLGGETQMQNLIEFYLKSKASSDSSSSITTKPELKEIHKNASRFKINCVLGNNGGGKSRLFDAINDKGDYLDQRGNQIVTFVPNSPMFVSLDRLVAGESPEKLFQAPTIYNQTSSKNIDWKTELWIDVLTGCIPFTNVKNVFDSFLGLNLQEEDITITIFFTYYSGSYRSKERKELLKDIGKALMIPIEKKWLHDEAVQDNDKEKKKENFITEDETKRCEALTKFCSHINNRDTYGTGDFSSHKYENVEFNIYKKLQEKDENTLYFFIFSTGTFSSILQYIESKQRIDEQKKKEIEAANTEKEKKTIEKEYGYKALESPQINLEEIKNIFGEEAGDHGAYKEYQKVLTSIGDENSSGEKNYEVYVDVLGKFFEGMEAGLSVDLTIGDIQHDNNLQSSGEFTTAFGSYFNVNLQFERERTFSDLSSGEKIIIWRFLRLYSQVADKTYDSVTILIDEPDLHLHLDWQKKYIQKLIDVFSTLDTNIKLHFILATHSPFIISDLPAECIVKLEGKGKEETKEELKKRKERAKKEEKSTEGFSPLKYTKITNYDGKEHSEFENFQEFKKHSFHKKTFGANYVDIINDGFFFDDEVLMGGFAESVIGDVAHNDRHHMMNNPGFMCGDGEGVKKQIGDEYLKDNLLYFVKGEKNAES